MDAHGHAAGHGHGKDHVPHVLPFKIYLRTWLTLLVLTAVTVGASYINFGPLNLWIALLIATIKALVVALIFMHLFYDQKFHSVIFGVSAIFLAIMIGFTMFDTEARGRAESVEADRPVDIKNPFSGSRSEQRIKERVEQREAGGEHHAAGEKHSPEGGEHQKVDAAGEKH